MKKIAIDVDEVISSEADAIIAFSKKELGIALSREDFTTPGEYWGYYERFWKQVGKPTDEVFADFLRSEHKKNQIILDDVADKIRRLKEGYSLEIVTSRGASFKDMTLSMIEKHLPDIFDDIHFVDIWREKSREATKATICNEIGAGFLIDDSPEHCNLAAEAGVKALLFGNFGWSVSVELHEDVERVADWQEVMDYFGV